MKDIVFAVVLCIALVLSFSVGKSYGRKTASEYVAMKERQDAENAAFLARLDVEYVGSADETCDKIFDLVIDHMNYLISDDEIR